MSVPLVFPRELTPELREVLALMLWHTGPIALVLRTDGAEIPRRAEYEQAHVLHWLIGLALEHGLGWKDIAIAKVDAARTRLADTPPATSPNPSPGP